MFSRSSTVFGTRYFDQGLNTFRESGSQKNTLDTRKKVAHYFRHAAVVLASAPLRSAHKINFFLLSQSVFVVTTAGQEYDNGKNKELQVEESVLSSSSSHANPFIVWYPKVHRRVHKSLISILSPD